MESVGSCGLAYLPLAFSGLLVLYFRALVEGGADLVPLTLTGIGLAGWLDLQRLTPDLGTLRLLIYPIIIVGGVFSWIILGQLKKRNIVSGLNCFGHRSMVVLTTTSFIFIL